MAADHAQKSGSRPIGDVLVELDSNLRHLIISTLAVKTMSYSSFGAKMTGNAYQAVRLREEILPGFRTSNEGLYSGLGIEGHSLVDLGCNLGERTRQAIAAGATFAEGVEYEELFARVGGLINVYNRIGNIVIRQGDITQPGCLTGDFDIGACFSAFVYVQQNLEEVLSKIRRLFILETHALSPGWFLSNLKPVSKHMPYWMIYDFSDHGAKLSEGKRACIVFARETGLVADVAEQRAEMLGSANRYFAEIDLEHSPRVVELLGDPTKGTRQLFQEMRDALKAAQTDREQLVRDHLRKITTHPDMSREPVREDHFASDRYWLSFFKGLLEYLEAGETASPQNTYIQYLRNLGQKGLYDPGMRDVLEDPVAAVNRLTPRFRVCLEVLTKQRIGGPPLIIYNAVNVAAAETRGCSFAHRPRSIIQDLSGRTYWTGGIDGFHRVAMLYLSGAKSERCVFVWTNVHPFDAKPLDGKASTSPAIPWHDPALAASIEATVDQLLTH